MNIQQCRQTGTLTFSHFLSDVERFQIVLIEDGLLEAVDPRRGVEELPHSVHPGIRHPHEVLLYRLLLVPVKRVGKVLERVTYTRAGHGHDLRPAHPSAEGQLRVLSAPDAKGLVEGPDGLEEGLIDGYDAADDRRGREGKTRLNGPCLLVVRHLDPRVPGQRT